MRPLHPSVTINSKIKGVFIELHQLTICQNDRLTIAHTTRHLVFQKFAPGGAREHFYKICTKFGQKNRFAKTNAACSPWNSASRVKIWVKSENLDFSTFFSSFWLCVVYHFCPVLQIDQINQIDKVNQINQQYISIRGNLGRWIRWWQRKKREINVRRCNGVLIGQIYNFPYVHARKVIWVWIDAKFSAELKYIIKKSSRDQYCLLIGWESKIRIF